MIGTWFNEMFGGEQTLDAASAALISAYAWAKEWQILLAGLLVLVAALIVARAIRSRPPAMRPAPRRGQGQVDLDLRLASKAKTPGMSPGPVSLAEEVSGELVGELEQLRSLIRSALAAFTLTAEKENSPVLFLCQRITRLKPERFSLSAGAAKAQHDTLAALLEQLEALRQQLKKDAQPAEISGTLIQLNTSARSLLAALAPQAATRRPAAVEQR